MAAIPAALLLLMFVACTGMGEAGLSREAKVGFSGSNPKVLLLTAPYGPADDFEGVDWTGKLRYVSGCDCILLEEDDAEGVLTFITWPHGSRGYSEGSMRGVQLPDGRQLKQDEAVTGLGWRDRFDGPPPTTLPAPHRARSDCLLVSSVS
jgi:hypothetical protein